jgi:hypothetical protein
VVVMVWVVSKGRQSSTRTLRNYMSSGDVGVKNEESVVLKF